jgi:PAS domain S-box-containing protein
MDRAPKEPVIEVDRFFDLSLDLMCVAGFDGRFRRVNPAWETCLGWTPAEMTAHPWLHFVHPDDVEKTMSAGSRLTDSRLPVLDFENRYRCRDGSYRRLQWRSLPLPQEGLIYGIARDVTETREAEARIHTLASQLERKNAELHAANHELESFAYSVSHDLRAPLRAIDGFALILVEDHADRLDDRGKDAVARVRAAAGRMGRLIDDLLSLSRIARADMTRAPVDLSALAASVVEDLRAASPDRDVVVEVEPGLRAEGDARLLRILLVNLLGNAWKYTAKKPRARVQVGRTTKDGVPAFFVRDDGAGFPGEYASRLFRPFERLHLEQDFSGTGIGLATVQRIVARHGGRVFAEGVEGKGATFSFTLG